MAKKTAHSPASLPRVNSLTACILIALYGYVPGAIQDPDA